MWIPLDVLIASQWHLLNYFSVIMNHNCQSSVKCHYWGAEFDVAALLSVKNFINVQIFMFKFLDGTVLHCKMFNELFIFAIFSNFTELIFWPNLERKVWNLENRTELANWFFGANARMHIISISIFCVKYRGKGREWQ